MSKLEDKYKQNIGKLYTLSSREWARPGWIWVENLLFITGVTKQGGWYHYDCDVVKYNLTKLEITASYHRNRVCVPCKEFIREAKPAVSLLGDTGEKEVAGNGQSGTINP